MQKDKEIIQSLTKRLSHLEALNQSVRLEIKEKTVKNENLKHDLE